MKQFSFSLQRLLGYKEQLFEAEQTILGEMQAVLRQLQSQLEHLQQQRKERTAAFREKVSKGTTAYEMELHQTYLRMLDHEMDGKRKQIHLQQLAIEKQMDKVREAKIEISTMEKLKEKKLEEYNYAANKAQEQFIEEYISTQRAMGISEHNIS